MIKRNQRKLNLINAILDFILVLVAYFGSLWIRYTLLSGVIPPMMQVRSIILAGILFGFIFVLIYYLMGLYSSFRFKRLGSENIKIILINAVCALILMAWFYIWRIVDFSRWVIVFFWILTCILIILKRYVVRKILRKYRSRNYNQKHIAVLGNGHLAHQFVKDVANDPYLGLCIDGYISAIEKEELGTCLGSYEDLEKITEEHQLDMIVVALEPHESNLLPDVMRAADKEGVRVELIPFHNDYYPAKPSIEVVGKSKLIDLRATPLDSPGLSFVKRAGDIVISGLMIIILSPLMLFALVGVKVTSPGPILFKQQRIGKDKKVFTMLKFRSMRNDINHEGWSTDNDPRKTKFGSLIRKLSIDELPQLFNVFAGQMSLVGPRPEIPKYVMQFKDEIPMYMLRHQVRPGMTGWAQINGLRGDTPIRDRVEYDIWYIQNWSLDLDISILFKTLCGGFVNKENVKSAGEDK